MIPGAESERAKFGLESTLRSRLLSRSRGATRFLHMGQSGYSSSMGSFVATYLAMGSGWIMFSPSSCSAVMFLPLTVTSKGWLVNANKSP
jgi:hypothetical protein